MNIGCILVDIGYILVDIVWIYILCVTNMEMIAFEATFVLINIIWT